MDEKQALWTCLRASFTHKLEYWLGMLHPSQVEEAARKVDSLFWGVLQVISGSHLPREEGPVTCQCCPTVEGLRAAIPGLSNTTYQELTVQLPIKKGGFGLRSQEFLVPYAYYGTLEQSVPHYSLGLCPGLAHLYGEQELGEARRWEPLLTSDTRTGKELARVLDKIKKEAEALANYMGEEVPFHHASEAGALGEGRKDGSTRHLMVKEIERLRAAALKKYLEEYQDQSARPVLVRKNTNKTSTAFLLARPGPHNGIHGVYFSEQLLALLAVPSVLCRGREGERVGKLKVDKWGDNILNCNVPGGHFTRGHNIMKNTLNSLFKYCGLMSEVEPYGVFGDLIPQQPLNRILAHRASQAIIPDLRVELPVESGGTKPTYLEVKTVSGHCWYKPPTERAVKRRDIDVMQDYQDNASKADIKHYKVPQGPITARLAQIGPIVPCCFGRFGESSDAVHKMVSIMAKARVEKQQLAWGRGQQEEKSDMSQETAFIRRRISCAIVACFGQRLTSRMSQVGNGAVSARERRSHWSRDEERSRRDREAAWLAKITGQDIVRRGRFWT